MTKQNVRVVGKALDEAESQNRKTELDRMAAMLSRLGGRGYQVREEATAYDGTPIDPDPYSDNDLDETKPQQSGRGDGLGIGIEMVAVAAPFHGNGDGRNAR